MQDLSLRIRSFNVLSASNQQTWANNESLRKLSLHGHYSSEDEYNVFLANKHLINTSNVCSLELKGFKPPCAMKVLFDFTQLEHLTLDYVSSYDDYTMRPSDISKLPKVKFLEISEVSLQSHLAIDIVVALRDELEALKLYIDRSSYFCLLGSKLFAKLHKIDMVISFDGQEFEFYFKWLSYQKALDCVDLTLSLARHTTPEETRVFFGNICTASEKYTNDGHNDCQFHLRLNIGKLSIPIPKTVQVCVAVGMKKIVEVLNLSNQNNWKLILRMRSDGAINVYGLLSELRIEYAVSYEVKHTCQREPRTF